MKLVNSLALAGILGLSTLYGANYNVDIGHSHIGFKVKHMMISNVRGDFKKFSGTFVVNEKTKHISSINGIVQVASLTTQNAQRDKDLKNSAFFDVKKYPTMKMKLIKQDGDKATLELTIKDVTKTIEMNIEDINGPVKDPWGYTRMAFELHGQINRKDFHMNFNKLLETGGLLVGDKVKIDISIEGTRGKQ